jgi:quercetin dioxygenase-like cupin family protein
MAPLWKVMKSVVTDEPVTRCKPHVWHYGDVKALVMESGGLISAEEAERRVLILENPALHGESATNSLFAGIQMIMPGEVAPAHRHAASAIRFVLDGEGAYTAVEGEKAFMAPGDFVITANWAPHDHGNPSKEPMLWLDVLDVPTVNFFEASFAEHSRRTNAGGDPSGRRFTVVLRVRRAARRYSRHEPHSGHQLHLRAHAPDRRAHDGRRQCRQAPRRARALRQSGHRRGGAADAERGACHAAEGVSRRAVPRQPTAPSSSASKARARPRSTARCSNGAKTTFSSCRRGSATRIMRASNRCCSRFPIVRRNKRSASGARPRIALRFKPGYFFTAGSAYLRKTLTASC